MIFYENIHWLFMKFYDSFYETLQNFVTLIVSQKKNTQTSKIDNYVPRKQQIDVYCSLFHGILDLY